MAACEIHPKPRESRTMTIASDSKGNVATGFGDMFTPKLVTVFREGYTFAHLRADAIGSVANFLATFGWQAGELIAMPADYQGSDLEGLLAQGIKPHTTLAQLKTRLKANQFFIATVLPLSSTGGLSNNDGTLYALANDTIQASYTNTVSGNTYTCNTSATVAAAAATTTAVCVLVITPVDCVTFSAAVAADVVEPAGASAAA